jgi:hypothetical protein
MHLVSCATPHDPLEAAPCTALLSEAPEAERWEGFWAEDTYYVRFTARDGVESWYQLADDEPVAPRDEETRVLIFRSKTQRRSRVTAVVAQSPAGRRMLVGSARRTTR